MQVYFVRVPSFTDWRDWARKDLDRMALSWDNYRCPFDFLAEFDQWIEWKIREYGRHENTGTIITDMLSDIERIKKYKIDRPFRFFVSSDFVPWCLPRFIGMTTI